jgi:hypothetical protein
MMLKVGVYASLDNMEGWKVMRSEAVDICSSKIYATNYDSAEFAIL